MKMIWAESEDGAIGKENSLLWFLPEDLAFFKESTLGSAIIMGRKTWESLPFKPLPGRQNVILTRESSAAYPAEIVHSVEEAAELYPGAWVIGGASLYEAFMPFTTAVHRTVVEGVYPEADTHAPKGWMSDFELLYSKEDVSKTGIKYRMESWSRLDGL